MADDRPSIAGTETVAILPQSRYKRDRNMVCVGRINAAALSTSSYRRDFTNCMERSYESILEGHDGRRCLIYLLSMLDESQR